MERCLLRSNRSCGSHRRWFAEGRDDYKDSEVGAVCQSHGASGDCSVDLEKTEEMGSELDRVSGLA